MSEAGSKRSHPSQKSGAACNYLPEMADVRSSISRLSGLWRQAAFFLCSLLHVLQRIDNNVRAAVNSEDRTI